MAQHALTARQVGHPAGYSNTRQKLPKGEETMDYVPRIDWLTGYFTDVSIVASLEVTAGCSIKHNWEVAFGQKTRCRVVLSGQKLEELRERATIYDILALFWEHAHISRCDIAFDFPTQYDIEQYYLDQKDNARLTMTTSNTGTTCYSGSRRSRLFVRLYDKKKECSRRGVDIEETTRIEIEAKKHLAKEAFQLALVDGWHVLLGWTVKKLPGCTLLETIEKCKPERVPKCKLRGDRCWWVVERYKKSIQKAYIENPGRFWEVLGLDKYGAPF